jgi:hypothetical protein
MRLRALIPVLIAVLVVALIVAAMPAPAAKKGPAVAVRVLECSTGNAPEQRFATFRSAMRRIARTNRMWMRFQLEERFGGRRFRAVKAPGLGVWKKSRKGVRGLAVTQRVLELGQGASYRMLVRFRWYDSSRKLIRSAKKRSRVCRQPGLLPNVRVRSVSGTRIAPGTVRYAVQIVNRGRAPAAGVGVRFSVDGNVIDTRTVASLAAGTTKKVFFSGPVCSSGVRAEVDPANTIAESDELDNTRVAACPSRR